MYKSFLLSSCPCGECQQMSAHKASLSCCHQMEALWCRHLDNKHMATMTTENNPSDTGYSSDSEQDNIQPQMERQYSCVTEHPGFETRYLNTDVFKEAINKLKMANIETNKLPHHRLLLKIFYIK